VSPWKREIRDSRDQATRQMIFNQPILRATEKDEERVPISNNADQRTRKVVSFRVI
jgi:hypothetical protein